ncbi:hypothetical protein Clacol_000152 [Clathrus columnatus]|uniref:Uncharacterized protein n=1 Tax=Clathrus columnatus TaxID=1419009 RepID=A0AAV5A246_9AGAM|nr:hypothetical protein Clacol_000152 [Clathrus columnatus]
MGNFKADTSDNDDMTPLWFKNYYKSAFDEITSFYPNEFYIQVGSSSATPHLLSLFATIINKFNNLNEISLNNYYLNPSGWTIEIDEEKNIFLDALRSAKSIRKFTVFGNDFVTFCRYLNDGILFPNLERLAYSTWGERDFLDPLLKMMTERRKICPQLLEVELTGFPDIPPEVIEPAERLGLRLIKKPRVLPPNPEPQFGGTHK